MEKKEEIKEDFDFDELSEELDDNEFEEEPEHSWW